MTTIQIVVLAILFIIDVALIIRSTSGRTLHSMEFLGHFVRLMLMWALLITAVMSNNDCQEAVQGKCPQFEPVTETYYKRKL